MNLRKLSTLVPKLSIVLALSVAAYAGKIPDGQPPIPVTSDATKAELTADYVDLLEKQVKVLQDQLKSSPDQVALDAAQRVLYERFMAAYAEAKTTPDKHELALKTWVFTPKPTAPVPDKSDPPAKP